MTRSMTAFAREQASESMGVLVWELRSVNHRYLDIHMRLPEEFRAKETGYREIINSQLSRGKVECVLRFKPEADVEKGLKVNKDLAKAVIHSFEEINAMLHQHSTINVIDILNWPGVLKESSPDMKLIMAASEESLSKALQALKENRVREGDRLGELVLQRCHAIDEIVKQVRQFMPDIQSSHRQKLLDRLGELNADPDTDRFEQELVYLAQKMDVDEELDRLDTHIKEIVDVLGRDEAVGRRLDFLMQELNREANTLGSKSADIRMTQASVELKVLIEQMREQIQNIE